MRLTRAQALIFGAVALAVVAKLGWRVLPHLGIGGWPEGGVPLTIALTITNSLIAPVPIVLLFIGLRIARPSSAAGREVRAIALNLGGIMCALVGLAALFAKIGDPHFRQTDVGIPLLPLGLYVLFDLYKSAGVRLSRLFFSQMGVMLLVIMGLFAALVGVTLLIAMSGHLMVAQVLYYTLFAALLFLWPMTMVINAALRWWASQQGSNDVLLTLSCYLPLNWRELNPDNARTEWASLYDVPEGAALLGGWTFRNTGLVKLEWLDEDGRRWQLVRNVSGVWAQWVGGLFLKNAGQNGGLRAGVFERLDCAWTPIELQKVDAVAARMATAFRSAEPPQAWACRDCPQLRFDFVDEVNGRCTAFTNLPSKPDQEWYAGLIFTFMKVPIFPPAREPIPAIAH
ncbi:MAG: hypothetical protein WEE64_00885 [Dehalococcoidia bacterium]